MLSSSTASSGALRFWREKSDEPRADRLRTLPSRNRSRTDAGNGGAGDGRSRLSSCFPGNVSTPSIRGLARGGRPRRRSRADESLLLLPRGGRKIPAVYPVERFEKEK